jgi:hypothetical protein
MEYKEIQEMNFFLCRHEDFMNNNMTSISLETNKVHENEHEQISQNVVIMDTLL